MNATSSRSLCGGHFGGGDHFDGGDHFGGGTVPTMA